MKRKLPISYEKTEYPYIDPSTQPYTIELTKGKYLFECYGASGDDSLGGKGAYTSAFATIDKHSTFYVYVGGKGSNINYDGTIALGGFNGGGNGGKALNKTYSSGGGGGGASDIRLNGGEWNNIESLNSRIMVAGGGGGGGFGMKGGDGGKQEGCCSQPNSLVSDLPVYCGGTEKDGNFGYGLNADDTSTLAANGAEGKGGGGGGYYGGLASQETNGYKTNAAGGGGSSYISGDIGFKENSSFRFLHSLILNGSEHSRKGDGLVIISKISLYTIHESNYKSFFLFIFILKT